MSNFRNVAAFDKDLNHGGESLRRYNLMINNATLDKLLTKLSENVEFPSDDREVLRAVSTVSKNDTTTGEPVWCLNKLVTLDKFGTLIDNADFNLEWVSHLTEGDGHNIA